MEEKELKNKINKKNIIIIILIIFCIVILGIILLINCKNNDSKDNDVIEHDNVISESGNNIDTQNIIIPSDDLVYEDIEYNYVISKENLFVNRQEEKYKNYSHKIEVITSLNDKFYIEDENVYVKRAESGEVTQVNINNEKAKYLEIGADCGGNYIYILTEEGNIYGGHNYYLDHIELMYDKKNAKEMVRINESKIYTTCGEVSILPLVNNELLNRNKYSIAYWLGLKDYVRSDDAVYNHDPKFLLNKDGTINKYLYNDVVHNVVKDALIKNEKGENLLVSFVYVLNDKVNIIDTEGNIYQINTIDKYKGDTLTEFKLNKINQNKKVKNIDLKLEYSKHIFRYEESYIYRNPNLTLIFDDGTKEVYSYQSYKIEFDNHYINQ